MPLTAFQRQDYQRILKSFAGQLTRDEALVQAHQSLKAADKQSSVVVRNEMLSNAVEYFKRAYYFDATADQVPNLQVCREGVLYFTLHTLEFDVEGLRHAITLPWHLTIQPINPFAELSEFIASAVTQEIERRMMVDPSFEATWQGIGECYTYTYWLDYPKFIPALDLSFTVKTLKGFDSMPT